MEVLNASAPGARVRVVRAAYHSSSGPGVPASSYMMHSSRRVISSGTRLLSPSLTNRPFVETPSLPSLPMEISSTPLDTEPDMIETENYKVTEPDDSEISAPSKWKSSPSKHSIRMPSEESSSTDNASIIDLDTKNNHRSIFRKYSYDSENSDISSMKLGSSRASPLLDAPVTLSTLKYKSLLNGSNDWNNRRKSYSFEETAPIQETISHCNDTVAMESSTDSGICKSSELVNDYTDYDRRDRKHDAHEDSFKDWLHKNRQTAFNKTNSFKSYRDHNVVIEEPNENNIAVQSKGKVSITIPITLETEDEYQYKKSHTCEEADKKVKKVEFCKTELHFAAESGKVNIIATDEKPPPTNDFRRKKSAFVPINNKPERPITLFGDNKKADIAATIDSVFNHDSNEIFEFDENTAATKSILKNKIPKPKPYLLGENMGFGLTDDRSNATKTSINNEDAKVPTAVSLINSQLQSERRFSNDTSSLSSDTSALKTNLSRPITAGLSNSVSSERQDVRANEYSTSEMSHTFSSAKNKFTALQMSPIPTRAKTRQLRQSDLTYFGIETDKKSEDSGKPKFIRDRIKMQNDAIDNIFQSVRLIQQVSSSVCNSEAESEDAVEYQNIPLKTNFAPVPTPRSRTKYADKSENGEKVTILKPIIEQDSQIIRENAYETRRSRSRKHEEVVPIIRSISEPPKVNKLSMDKSHRRKQNQSTRNNKSAAKHAKDNDSGSFSPETAKLYLSDEDENSAPIYVNLNNNVVDHKTALVTEDVIHTPESTRTSSVNNEVQVNPHKEPRRNQQRVHIRRTASPKDSHHIKTSSNKTLVTEDVIHTPESTRTSNVTNEVQVNPHKESRRNQQNSFDRVHIRRTASPKDRHYFKTNSNKTMGTEDVIHTPESTRTSNVTNEVQVNPHKESRRNQQNSYDIVHLRRTASPKDSHHIKTSSNKKNKVNRPEVLDVSCSDHLPSDPPSSTRRTSSQESKRKEDQTNSSKKQSGSHKRGDKSLSEQVTEQFNRVNKGAKEPEEVLKPQRVRSSSRHSAGNKDTTEHHKRPGTDSSDRHRNSLQMKSTNKNGEVRYSKDRPKSKRNEYVINYDDKNGTVTSVCKVSSDSGSTKKKNTALERVKDVSREHRSLNKTSDKRNLLQFPEPERNSSRMSHAYKRSNTKVYIQRSCQLL